MTTTERAAGTGGASGPGAGAGWLRRWYGSGPAHLAALTLGGLVGIYAASKLLSGDPWGVIIWIAAAAVLHDLVLVPGYTALDRAARAPLGTGTPEGPGVPFWYDHIRVPTMLSGLLLLVFFPLILRIPPRFSSITGTSVEVYLGRYLSLVGGMYALSGLVFLARVLLRRRR